jgi:predicted LPLAT superfamily acyltransferase
MGDLETAKELLDRLPGRYLIVSISEEEGRVNEQILNQLNSDLSEEELQGGVYKFGLKAAIQYLKKKIQGGSEVIVLELEEDFSDVIAG